MSAIFLLTFNLNCYCTPIEIALGIDEDGKTTARKLYEFLKMDKTHYSRWVKSNITENSFAEENVDYWALAIDGERNFNPNPSQDFKLSANFAKKLSMQGKTEKAELARDYFIRVEEKLKEAVQPGCASSENTYSGCLYRPHNKIWILCTFMTCKSVFNPQAYIL